MYLECCNMQHFEAQRILFPTLNRYKILHGLKHQCPKPYPAAHTPTAPAGAVQQDVALEESGESQTEFSNPEVYIMAP
jgi:hypothetical protein